MEGVAFDSLMAFQKHYNMIALDDWINLVPGPRTKEVSVMEI